MALIKCPECQREISDKASVCPHCGVPLDIVRTHTAVDPTGGPSIAPATVPAVTSETESPSGCGGCLLLLGGLFGLGGIIMALVGFQDAYDELRGNPESPIEVRIQYGAVGLGILIACAFMAWKWGYLPANKAASSGQKSAAPNSNIHAPDKSTNHES